METFDEFNKSGTVPNRNSGDIISHALGIYKGIFMYPIIAGLFFFVVISILMAVTGFFGVVMDLSKAQGPNGYDPSAYTGLYTTAPFLTFAVSSSLINILLFSPLVIGVLYIAHKYNKKEQIHFNDLFIGFRQNFLHIAIFGIIFSIVSSVSTQLCYLPAVFILPFFFLGFPFLLFQNATAFQAIGRSFEVVKNNYVDFLIINLLAFLCSMLGIVACCIGIIITYMFYYSTMYSAYLAYVGMPKEINSN